jgi:hypothetical protein
VEELGRRTHARFVGDERRRRAMSPIGGLMEGFGGRGTHMGVVGHGGRRRVSERRRRVRVFKTLTRLLNIENKVFHKRASLKSFF